MLPNAKLASREIRAKFIIELGDWRNEIPDFVQATEGEHSSTLLEVLEMIDRIQRVWCDTFFVTLDYELKLYTDDLEKPQLCEVRLFRMF